VETKLGPGVSHAEEADVKGVNDREVQQPRPADNPQYPVVLLVLALKAVDAVIETVRHVLQEAAWSRVGAETNEGLLDPAVDFLGAGCKVKDGGGL
jgi:hypothetical protein